MRHIFTWPRDWLGRLHWRWRVKSSNYLLIPICKRGGIAMISKRYARGHNPYLQDYDPEQLSNYLLYLDANNLYGWAMSQPLPTHDFQSFIFLTWMRSALLKYFSSRGWRKRFRFWGWYNISRRVALLSGWLQKDVLSRLGMKEGSISKLVPNLFDEKKYVVHYRNFQLYLALGMTLSKVHRVLSFEQSPWLSLISIPI